MKLLYSSILPLKAEEGQEKFIDCFLETMSQADAADIAVGYVSKASLGELGELVKQYGIGSITLVMGMYFLDGMPEGTYNTAKALHAEWTADGIGEIRLVRPIKYHGKVYLFYKGGNPFRAFIGSNNLGSIKTEASNIRQYEISAATENTAELDEIAHFITRLKTPSISLPINEITGMTLIREVNNSLTDVDTVDRVPQSEVDIYRKHETDISFELPIKVPAFSERHLKERKYYTKSNLNVCYAAPRSERKARNWYETQLTVSRQITQQPGYPVKNTAFFVVTDDGYTFKAHTTSSGNKQFSAVGDELIMGRWVKGRLAAAGLVSPVNNTSKDADRLSMITKEMLASYGCDTIVLTKTDQRKEDENGNAVGARLDADPLLFFALRGIDPTELIKKTVDEKMKTLLANAEKKSGRVIDEKDVGRIFGV